MREEREGSSEHPAKKGNGYTLVELLVAMTIFLIAMLHGLSFFTYGSRFFADAKQTGFALRLAQDALENWGSAGYGSIPALLIDTQQDDSAVAYTRRMTATAISTAQEEYKIIRVAVTWPVSGSTQSVHLSSIVAPE